MFSNIDEAINWVMNRRKNNYSCSFERFKQVMDELGNPQNDFYTIHVTGTNGKGSTVNYLSDLLTSHGFRVGTMQSPHFITHLDRIRISNVNIPGEDYLELLNRYLPIIEKNDIGMFAIDYIIACFYFKKQNIDLAVIEVGIGGRLDQTNVVDNTKLSIITTIGLDHMDRLGNSLEEITKEKCGIIKNNSKVLAGKIEDKLKAIIKETCIAKNSAYYEVKEYEDLGNRKFKYNGELYEISSYAKYQIDNACLALEAFHIVAKDYPFTIDTKKEKEALKKSVWRGRFEIVKENPRVILDGAHNVHGATALMQSFDLLTGSKAIVYSALERKEHKEMFDLFKKHCDKLYVTTFYNAHDKTFDLSKIKDNDVEIYDDYKEAITDAMSKYDNVLVCGSLYFISEVVENYKF